MFFIKKKYKKALAWHLTFILHLTYKGLIPYELKLLIIKLSRSCLDTTAKKKKKKKWIFERYTECRYYFYFFQVC